MNSGCAAPPASKPRLVCFVNGIYSHQVGGGDIYFSHMMQAAREAGFDLHFFGGHALKAFLENQQLPQHITLTDRGMGRLGNVASLLGQFRLLLDFAGRWRQTLSQLELVRPQDIAYAMSDYWFDAIPLMRCSARRRIMYLGMMAPSFGQVLRGARGDITASRINSLYYWASQQYSLRAYQRCRPKFFTYGHPHMKNYLRQFGYKDEELVYVPNGMDVATADRIPPQRKAYDLVWTGRVHPQKGIEDLLAALKELAGRIPGFKALIIGKSKDQLLPRIQRLRLDRFVTFSGLVTEEEKFRLLKASRVFAMPSRYESWGIVVGEALVSGIQVVAYDLDCYRPVFGDHLTYVPCFDRGKWIAALAQTIDLARCENCDLKRLDLEHLKMKLSWESSRKTFAAFLIKLTALSEVARAESS